jgi:hypothetical protein
MSLHPKLLLTGAVLAPLALLATSLPAHAEPVAQPLPFNDFGACSHPLVPGLYILTDLGTAAEFSGGSNDVSFLVVEAPDAQGVGANQAANTEVESIRVDYYNEEMRPELLIEGTQEKYSVYSLTKSAPTGSTTFPGKEDVGLVRVRVTWSKAAGATGKEVLTCYRQLGNPQPPPE